MRNDAGINHCGSHAPDRNAEASATVLTMPFIAADDMRNCPMKNPSDATISENTNVPHSVNSSGRVPMPVIPPWQVDAQMRVTAVHHSHIRMDARQQTSSTCIHMLLPGVADTLILRMVVGWLNALMMTITMNAMLSING